MRVRQALAHAIDQPALVRGVFRGTVAPATGGLAPPGLPGHSPGIGLAYDPDRARRLLAEAGCPGGRGFPRIEAWINTSENGLQMGRYAQRQWRELLGIEFEWEEMDVNTYLRRLNASTPHLFVGGWLADFPDPVSFLDLAMHANYSRWRDTRYEQLLDAARRMPDQAERLKFYRAADRLLVEEAAIIPMLHFRWHLLKKPWVRQYPVSSLRVAYFADVILEAH